MLNKIKEIVQNVVLNFNFVLWGIEVNKKDKMIVYIDNCNGVRINDCEKIYKEIIKHLQVDKINIYYQLTVSSPGVDRKIFNVKQVKLLIGKSVKVLFYKNTDKILPLKTQGIIKDIDNDVITLQHHKQLIKFSFNKVYKMNINPFYNN